LQNLEAAGDHRGLILVSVDRHLVIAVAHEFPTVPLGLFGDARIVLADAGVDGERRPDSAPAEQIEETPGAHAHPVFVPAPIGNVRQQHLPGRRRQDLARHGPRYVPHFVIDDRPDDQARAARQLEDRPVDNRGKIAALAR
jgi:hypothetical protein